MFSSYMKPRGLRNDARTNAGAMRGGKLVPVMGIPFGQSESGLVRQNLSFELEPIAGRMVTPITMEIKTVFVPMLAVDLLKNPTDPTAGIAEIFREKMLAGDVFVLEDEGEISREMDINPISIGGVKKVREDCRLAYIAAANYLRRRLYVNAAQLANTTAIIQPAHLGETILQRLGGVLNPEDRVNGLVRLGIPDTDLKVKGIGFAVNRMPDFTATSPQQEYRETGNVTREWGRGTTADESAHQAAVRAITSGGIQYPYVFAELEGVETDGVSLTDFHRAEKMDAIVRKMRAMIDANPEHGEQIVARFASGLAVETGKQPWVVYETTKTFGVGVQTAMDQIGMENGFRISSGQLNVDLQVMVPATEFGGWLITLCSLKPDETLPRQPHPIATKPYRARNYAADELMLDPVPVRQRELSSDVTSGAENTVSFYTANNGLERTYISYGYNGNVNLATVAARTALWQLFLPLSVTPDSVVYPTDIDHYPFADNGPTAKPCHYTVQSAAVIATPTIFGPTPVEELAAIETEGIFDAVE